nr:immunoglobulin light chain junction region [Macaca mulatta]MOW02633.1 immunoglobulin light chain junction region [Macaca mulatta]MOW03095.1 immunoglobulin light chain junction region [Macaca mulatta]MOW03774.1 immunoglobulin light chain junction region [Macaca mulatta]
DYYCQSFDGSSVLF